MLTQIEELKQIEKELSSIQIQIRDLMINSLGNRGAKLLHETNQIQEEIKREIKAMEELITSNRKAHLPEWL